MATVSVTGRVSTTTEDSYKRKESELLEKLGKFLPPPGVGSNGDIVPNATGLGFYTKGPNQPTSSDDDSVDLSVVIPAVACFTFGILIASIIGFVLYKRQRTRWRNSPNNDANAEGEDNPKFAVFQNDPLGDFFQHKEGVVSQDVQSVLNFLATPFVCNSFDETEDSARAQALLEIQNEIDEEMRGCSSSDDLPLPFVLPDLAPQPAEAPGMNPDIVWSVPGSDVIVTIPAGALPRKPGSANTLKVALGANPLNVTTHHSPVQLSPLLILSSPRINRYLRPLEVRIPHRAQVALMGASWSVLLRYSGTSLENINKLKWTNAVKAASCSDSGFSGSSGGGDSISREEDVTFRYDTDFVYVYTHIPGLFCAVGNGSKKQKPLRIAAVAFAFPLPPQSCEPEPGQEQGNCGIDIKVYFIDYFREAIQYLKKTVEEEGGMCISKPLPLRMVNEKDWQVILVSADSPQWPYRIHDGQRVKVISTDSLYANLGLGQAAEFRVFSKLPPDGGVDQFQATFSLAQRRRNPASVVASLLSTEPFPLTRSEHNSVSSSLSRGSCDPALPLPLHEECLPINMV